MLMEWSSVRLTCSLAAANGTSIIGRGVGVIGCVCRLSILILYVRTFSVHVDPIHSVMLIWLVVRKFISTVGMLELQSKCVTHSGNTEEHPRDNVPLATAIQPIVHCLKRVATDFLSTR